MTISPFSNRILRLFTQASAALFTCGILAVPPVSHAQDKNARAIQNTTRLTAFLDGVPPENVMTIVEKIASGEIERFAPEQPIWIIDTSSGTLLFYQGQPTFKGKSATLLVDDAGARFGQKALDNGRNSRSGWVNVVLGGGSYSAFCHSKYPTIVCSLIP